MFAVTTYGLGILKGTHLTREREQPLSRLLCFISCRTQEMKAPGRDQRHRLAVSVRLSAQLDGSPTKGEFYRRTVEDAGPYMTYTNRPIN